MIIETLDDAIRARRHECAEAMAKEFHPSVRPMFHSNDEGKPEFLGSCILLEVNQQKFVVTAAHVIDWGASYAIYIGGSVGTHPIRILGNVSATRKPDGDRKKDRFDFAYWPVDGSAVVDLGSVEFIGESRVSKNQVPPKNRFYLAVGYPISRNKKNIENPSRAIKPALSKYTSEAVESPALAKKLGISGEDHFFLKFEKQSTDEEGNTVNSFKPDGMSGGALIDLASFTAVDRYDPNMKCVGYLAGLLIEHHADHKAMVAVKIGHIVDSIKRRSHML